MKGIKKLEENDFILYDNGISKHKLISNDPVNIAILASRLNEVISWINDHKCTKEK